MLVSASNCQAIYVCVEELNVESPRNLVVASLSVVWKDLVDRESGLELLQSAILARFCMEQEGEGESCGMLWQDVMQWEQKVVSQKYKEIKR